MNGTGFKASSKSMSFVSRRLPSSAHLFNGNPTELLPNLRSYHPNLRRFEYWWFVNTLKFIVENTETKTTYSGNLLIDTDKFFLPIQQERNFKFVSKKAIAALVSSLKNPKTKLEHKQVFDDALRQAIKHSGIHGQLAHLHGL